MDKERLVQNCNANGFFHIGSQVFKAYQYIIVNCFIEIHCSGQNLSDCKVAGETCVDGICRCGALSSCEARKTGALCDPRLGECRCSENLASCSNPFRGNICNSSSSSCTCSATALACNGNEYCTLGSCNGNFHQKLPNHNPYNHYY